jgi:hypothetical protein
LDLKRPDEHAPPTSTLIRTYPDRALRAAIDRIKFFCDHELSVMKRQEYNLHNTIVYLNGQLQRRRAEILGGKDLVCINEVNADLCYALDWAASLPDGTLALKGPKDAVPRPVTAQELRDLAPMTGHEAEVLRRARYGRAGQGGYDRQYWGPPAQEA